MSEANKSELKSKEIEENEFFGLNIFPVEGEIAKSHKEFLDHYRKGRNKAMIITLVTIALIVVVIGISFMLGRYQVPVGDVIKILLSKLKIFGITQTWDSVSEKVVLSIRIPRILAAVAVGSALAFSGGTYQSLFRNPMVSPDILGASAGASFGACLVMILFGQNAVLVQAAAFVFGLVAVGFSYFLSKAVGRGNNMILLLVLCGMTVNTLFNAGVSIIKYLADTEDTLPAITYWLMGSIAKVSYSDLLFFLFPFLLGIIPVLCLRWKLNIMAFGEDEAKAMGVNVSTVRGICVVCSTLLTSAVVSIAGTIGWVGLMIPHLVRFIVGPDNKRLLPMSALIGALFMLIVDNVCRTVLAYEIPLGVLTSIIGAPFFIAILWKRKGED